jgi:hypothetical protein
VRLRYDRQVSSRRSGAAEHQSARHVKSWFGATPCRRATKLTVVPGSNVSSTIRTFLRRYPAPTALNRRDDLNSIRQHASHSLVDEIWDLNHRAGTMTHDYKRHGTTTLFAALNVLDGTVIGRNMQRHRHQEFIRCLNAIEAQLLLGRVVHVILDNYTAHKHPKVRQWLDRHPFHFVPTSCSWLNAVEGFFAKLSERRLSAASSAPSSTFRPPSTASSRRPTKCPSPSSGPPTPTKSSSTRLVP